MSVEQPSAPPKSQGLQPWLSLATGLIAGRYVANLPFKVFLPVTLAAISTKWALSRTESSRLSRAVRHITIAMTMSVAFLRFYPQFTKRIWDILGLWLFVVVAPPLITKFMQWNTSPSDGIEEARRPKEIPPEQVLHYALRTFRDYFANDLGFTSLAESKKSLFDGGALQIATGINPEGSTLVLLLMRSNDEITIKVIHQSMAVPMKPAQCEAALRVLIPSQQDIEQALGYAAAQLTQKQVEISKSSTRSGYVLPTLDGRWWYVQQEGERDVHWLMQCVAPAVKGELVFVDEVVCAWEGFAGDPAVKISRELFMHIQQAFNRVG